jgi:hypothetical protein
LKPKPLGFTKYDVSTVNPTAEAVFIGMEEGLTLPPPLEEQLAIRSGFTPMMDLAESAKAHPEKFLSGDRPPIQSTWNPIIRILLALEGVRPRRIR